MKMIMVVMIGRLFDDHELHISKRILTGSQIKGIVALNGSVKEVFSNVSKGSPNVLGVTGRVGTTTNTGQELLLIE